MPDKLLAPELEICVEEMSAELELWFQGDCSLVARDLVAGGWRKTAVPVENPRFLGFRERLSE